MKAEAVREKPILFSAEMVRAILDGRKTQTRRIIRNPEKYEGSIRDCAFCAPYQVRDRLWVREAHRKDALLGVAYRADESDEFVDSHRWRPGIHMHKTHARLWLEVTDVRVQRVQEISDDDAWSEGVRRTIPADSKNPVRAVMRGAKLAELFAELWNTVNGPGAWERNDFVWVYTFKRIKR